MPRRCPLCKQASIIGHGKRRKQAHDEPQDWIWVRRGLCRLCGKTFSILPSWSPPYGHYSLHSRHQAWEAICAGSDWDQSAPHCKDPTRSPDSTTLRRWAWRRLLSLGQSLKVWLWVLDWHRMPTILVWDWMSAGNFLGNGGLPSRRFGPGPKSVETSLDAAASKTHPQMRGGRRGRRGFPYISVGRRPRPMGTDTSVRATSLSGPPNGRASTFWRM